MLGLDCCGGMQPSAVSMRSSELLFFDIVHDVWWLVSEILA
jgi:hypothetical protein